MAPSKNRTGTKKTSAASSSAASTGNKLEDFRMEGAEGVKTAVKADIASPESPVIADEKLNTVAPAEPEKIGKLEEGDTVASHEAHVLTSSPAAIAERLEREKDGEPTHEIAAEQQRRAARLETGRVVGTGRIAPGTRDSERPKRGG